MSDKEEAHYTVSDLIEELTDRFRGDEQVRFGRYEFNKGYYRIERLNVDEQFVTKAGDGGHSCDEETSERHNDGTAVRIVVIT